MRAHRTLALSPRLSEFVQPISLWNAVRYGNVPLHQIKHVVKWNVHSSMHIDLRRFIQKSEKLTLNTVKLCCKVGKKMKNLEGVLCVGERA